MNMVTILLVVIGVLGYAGLGYLAIKINADFDRQLQQALKGADPTYGLIDEYNRKTGIAFRNNALCYIAIVLVLLIWPISEMASTILDYAVYCKLMKKANQL